MKKQLALLLSCMLLLTSLLSFPAYAEGTDSSAESSMERIELASYEDLLVFAENCRSDIYSRNKYAVLTADIDLENKELRIPSFSGTFDGNGHTVKGLRITSDGSRTGFFRVLTETACVKDLTLNGEVLPGGTQVFVGGIAGSNAGNIENCTVSAKVCGVESVGGIAGINLETGTIRNCTFSGQVQGESKAGGIAGENAGLMDACVNHGMVNTEAVEETSRQTFDISSLLGADLDAVIALSDLGGIAGFSGGTVQNCRNTGTIGYTGIGYNVGGICGRTQGFISGCKNEGPVTGRRDVGGITGQQEPFAVWSLSENKIDLLTEQMTALSEAVSDFTQTTGANLAGISTAVTDMMTSANNAAAAVVDIAQKTASAGQDFLNDVENTIEEHQPQNEFSSGTGSEPFPAPENSDGTAPENSDGTAPENSDSTAPENSDGSGSDGISIPSVSGIPLPEGSGITLPDGAAVLPDSAEQAEIAAEIAASLADARAQLPDMSVLIESLAGIYGASSYVTEALGTASSDLAANAENVSARVSDVMTTLTETAAAASEGTILSEVDLSLDRAYTEDTGAVSGCANSGPVRAESNAGGITGTTGFEVAFDLENELDVSDALFTEAQHLIFAVIRTSENSGTVTIRKENAGGIAGQLAVGAIVDSVGKGEITASENSGDYLGGIAGQAVGPLKGNISRVILSGGKYIGGIAGLGGDITDCTSLPYIRTSSEYAGGVCGWSDGTLTGNRYAETGCGGMDGISLFGKAEGLSIADLEKEVPISADLLICTVTFLAEDTVVKEERVPFGSDFPSLPTITKSDDRYWKWSLPEDAFVYSDITVTGEYTEPVRTVATKEDPPRFLAEGLFDDSHTLTAEELSLEDLLPGRTSNDGTSSPGSDPAFTSAFRLTVPDYTESLIVHMRGTPDAVLYTLTDGKTAELSYTQDGSYLVFPLENGGILLTAQKDARPAVLPYLIAGGGILALLLFFLFVRKKKKGGAKAAQK